MIDAVSPRHVSPGSSQPGYRRQTPGGMLGDRAGWGLRHARLRMGCGVTAQEDAMQRPRRVAVGVVVGMIVMPVWSGPLAEAKIRACALLTAAEVGGVVGRQRDQRRTARSSQKDPPRARPWEAASGAPMTPRVWSRSASCGCSSVRRTRRALPNSIRPLAGSRPRGGQKSKHRWATRGAGP